MKDGLKLALKVVIGAIAVMLIAIIHFLAVFYLPAITYRTVGSAWEWPTIGLVFVSFLFSTTFAINGIVKLKV